MPEEKELVEEEEEEKPEPPRVTGVSLEDFNKWKSTMDRQVIDHRRRADAANAEVERLRGQMSILEKAVLPKGFAFEEDEEEEDEEGPKKKPKKELRQLRVLAEEKRQLEEELDKVRGKQQMQQRIDQVLTITGVSRVDPELDWAADETDPNVGFDRFQRSAMELAIKRAGQRQEVRAKVEKKKEDLPPTKVELGGPKAPISSFLERAKRGEVTPAEMDKVIQRARRRTSTGGSELSINELTS